MKVFESPILQIGFTGSQDGMTDEQYAALREFLTRDGIGVGHRVVFHHGDCIGADEEAHMLAHELAFTIIVHPPNRPEKRAWCGVQTGDWQGPPGGLVLEALPYLMRNRSIVGACELLIACPKTMSAPSNLRGQGTWWTVVHAIEQGVPVVIIQPTSHVDEPRKVAA